MLLTKTNAFRLVLMMTIVVIALLGVCPSNTKMAIFGGGKTPPGSPIIDPGAFYEVIF
jgi:hypothetical protein